MASGNGSRDRGTKWLRWIARVWSLPIIVWALLFVVGYASDWATGGAGDPYAVEDYPFTEALAPIFMLVSSLGLGIAWRWERWGGLIAAVFQLAALTVLLLYRPITHDFPRSGIPYLLWLIVTIPAILFLVCWRRSRQGTYQE